MGLRRWRFPSQSSPNISEAVSKESYPLLLKNALTQWMDPRIRREERKQDARRWMKTSSSLSSLACVDESQKTKVALSSASSCLSQALSVPESCSTSPSSGFSSITITARRVSISDLSSQEMKPINQTEQLPSASTSIESLRDDIAISASSLSSKTVVLLRCKAAEVKVNEDSDRYLRKERIVANLPHPERKNSCTDSGATSQALATTPQREAIEVSSLDSKRLIFRSCAHLELLPVQSTNSTFYLDKSLSIPLGCTQEDEPGLHRSTLSLYLGGASVSSHTEKLQKTRVPLRSSSEWNLVDFPCNGRGEQSRRLGYMATVSSRTTSSDSAIARGTLAPLPFRARCHSSSAVVRLNGKANDVSGPLQRNRKGGTEGPELAVINKRWDSPVIIRNKSAAVSVKCQGLEKMQSSSDSQDAEDLSASDHLLVNSGESVRDSHDGRMPYTHAGTVMKVQECLVSLHVLNCTFGSNSSNQDHLLSLKEALELFRPDFISRSQRRVHRLEQKARERRSSQASDMTVEMEPNNRRPNCTRPHPLSDNLFKPKDRVISGKEMQLRSRRIYNKLPEVTKKKEEEKRRMVLQTNRLRAEVFKKKLLDQILQRNSD